MIVRITRKQFFEATEYLKHQKGTHIFLHLDQPGKMQMVMATGIVKEVDCDMTNPNNFAKDVQ